MQSNQKRKPQLFLLMMVFVIPVLCSYFFYYYYEYFQFKTTNRGILVNPPIEAQYLYSTTKEGKQKKWRIIHAEDGACDDACQKINYQLSQVQKALGKESQRVDVISMNKNVQLERLMSAFVQHGEKEFAVKNKIYLVDPLGNLFMYYPNMTDPMNILKDLKKVLKVSQIG